MWNRGRDNNDDNIFVMLVIVMVSSGVLSSSLLLSLLSLSSWSRLGVSSWPNQVNEDVPLGWQVEAPPAKPIPSLLEVLIASCCGGRHRVLLTIVTQSPLTPL